MSDSVGTCLRMSETNVPALKEALLDQQQLLQKLYNELDVEREATATAASEALSMILRLQEEKAAVLMEASQYKRMAEEKMCHAEQTLGVLEELIYHKEMEIASLEFQVQAYRYRLMSLGWHNNDFGNIGENRYPEGFFPQRCDPLYSVEMGLNANGNNVGRTISLPALRLKENYQNGVFSSFDSVPPVRVEEYNDWEDMENKPECSTNGDLGTYWEQIKRLDERVKKISQCRDKSIVSSLSDQVPFYSNVIAESTIASGDRKCHENETSSNCSTSVHDVFVVPQSEESSRHKVQGKERSKSVTFGENVVLAGKADSAPQKVRAKPPKKEYPCNNQSDWIKKMLISLKHEDELPIERDNSDMPLEFQQLCQRIERLQKLERNVESQEISCEGEEELNLLKEIREQLNSIQKEMTYWRRKGEHPPEEGPMITLMEAMLHFWL